MGRECLMIDLVSLIIPVYNTPKKYLDRCLNSIRCQSYTSYEIIIIDDGSNKETFLYLDRLQQDIENAQVVHQLSLGVSAARNIGVQKAHGKYIAFIDSDDTIEPEFIQNAVKYLQENSLDVVIGGFRYIYSNGKKTDFYFNPNFSKKIEIYTGMDKSSLIAMTLEAKSVLQIPEFSKFKMGSVCQCLFDRKKISTIVFPENIIMSEDRMFCVKVFKEADRIGITNEVWYNYYQHEDSTVHKKGIDLFENHSQLLNMITNLEMSEDAVINKAVYEYVISLARELLRRNISILANRRQRRAFNFKLYEWVSKPIWCKIYNDYDGISLLVDDRILSYCIRKKNILGMWLSLFLSIAIRKIKK